MSKGAAMYLHAAGLLRSRTDDHCLLTMCCLGQVVKVQLPHACGAAKHGGQAGACDKA